MKGKRIRSAFTLIEVLIVVVIMAVLAATIIPQFTDSTKEARESSMVFNLHTMRAQIQLYKAQHNGKLPSATLAEMTKGTDISGANGSTYGPYMQSIPYNTINDNNVVTETTNDPAVVGDVTAAGAGGWLYNKTTGNIWIDHADYLAK
jgi:prepilin-type N-terminal cleavage/methylation domain-containing protein